jgi:hypothetical protein
MDYWSCYSGTYVCEVVSSGIVSLLSCSACRCEVEFALCDSWHIVRWPLVWGCVNAYASPLCTALVWENLFCTFRCTVTCQNTISGSCMLMSIYCFVRSVWCVYPRGCYCPVGLFCGVYDRSRDVVGGGFYGLWGFKRVSKILLGNMVWSSFRWLLLMYSSLLWFCSTCLVLWMVPNACACFVKMFCKFGCVAVVPKCVFVLVKPYLEIASGLSHVCLVAVGTW